MYKDLCITRMFYVAYIFVDFFFFGGGGGGGGGTRD
jgi:hypothetical protein